MSIDIQCAVEHTENVDIPAVFDQVGDAVVAVQQHANMPLGIMVAVPDFRVSFQDLGSIVDATDDSARRGWIIS
jgi:hypothetical protein